MAWTLAQYEALQNAIALGVKKVKYGDKETEYQSTADMLAVLDAMKQQLFPPDNLAGRRRVGVTDISGLRRYGSGGWGWGGGCWMILLFTSYLMA